MNCQSVSAQKLTASSCNDYLKVIFQPSLLCLLADLPSLTFLLHCTYVLNCNHRDDDIVDDDEVVEVSSKFHYEVCVLYM